MLRFVGISISFLLLLASLLMLGSIVVLTSMPARATDFDWSLSRSPHVPRRAQRVRRHRKVTPTQTVTRLFRPAEERHEAHCGGKTRGLGTQWIGTEGALEAAKKDWMERVRYDLGEAFLDLHNAQDFQSRCGRTSIGETMGQVMYRCEIIARPCRAQFVLGEAAKKD